MKNIKITKPCHVGGEDREPGVVMEVTNDLAFQLVKTDKTAELTGEKNQDQKLNQSVGAALAAQNKLDRKQHEKDVRLGAETLDELRKIDKEKRDKRNADGEENPKEPKGKNK